MPPFDLLGFSTYVGVAWLVVVIAPVLGWRRPWARLAAAATVLATCLGLVVLGQGEPPLVLSVSSPVLVAGGALVVALLARRARGDRYLEGVVGGDEKA